MVQITISLIPAKEALPAKQRPDTTAIFGTTPASAAKALKLDVARPDAETPSVSPGRPPPPSANQTTGNDWSAATSRMRSVLRWFMPPCVPAKTVKS